MNIKLNGEDFESQYKTAFQLTEALFGDERIVILNGFQIEDDCILNENDELVIIKKGQMPAQNELRVMMMARHTPHIHKKLESARVAIAGLGGLGSNIAVSLARLGVGELFLVDYDIVEPSNLNRQCYYISHLGMKKTDALKSQLMDINCFINIKTADTYINEDNVTGLFKDYPIVCEALDNPKTKSMLASVLLSEFPDVKIVAASGMAGFGSSNDIITNMNIRRLYVCGDQKNGAAIGYGLMSPRVQICAGHQANMVLRLILGIEEI